MAEYKKASTTFLQKLSLVFAGTLVGLIIIEMSFRFGGYAFLLIQEFHNRQNLHKNGSYTIMCIGESTTFYVEGGSNYPSLLEGLLNSMSAKIKFKVINKGVPGTKSKDIANSLDSNIREYRPDMIIAMVGINDVIYGRSDFKAFEDGRFYSRLRLYKLYKYIWRSYWRKKNDFGSALMKKEPLMDDRLTKANPQALLLERFAVSLTEYSCRLRNHSGCVRESVGLFHKAIQIYPHKPFAYIELITSLTWLHDEESLKKVYELAIKNMPMNDWGYSGLANYYANRNPKLAEYYRQRSEKLRSSEYDDVVRDNYRKIKKIADFYRIKLVCVQYPLRNVEPLKRLFDDPADMVFVDNETSFKEAVKRQGYNAIFSDNFAGDFGHCTRDGNILLAKNVKQVVIHTLGIKDK